VYYQQSYFIEIIYISAKILKYLL